MVVQETLFGNAVLVGCGQDERLGEVYQEIRDSLYFGFEIEFDSPEDHCPACDGTGHEEVECTACDGAGEIEEDCHDCDGAGEIGAHCWDCDGSGKDADGDPCPHCDGEGEVVSRCRSCDGTGTYRTECPSCGSSGTHRDDCSDCDGTGTVNGRDDVESDLPGWGVHGEHCGLEADSEPTAWGDRGALLADLQRAFRNLELSSDPIGANGENQGIHVHVSFSHPEDQSPILGKKHLTYLLRLWAANEEVIYSLAKTTSERSESWTQRFDKALRASILLGRPIHHLLDHPYIPVNRYYGMNLHALAEHGTVEFRLWNGSSDLHYWRLAVEASVSLVAYAAALAELGLPIPTWKSPRDLVQALELTAPGRLVSDFPRDYEPRIQLLARKANEVRSLAWAKHGPDAAVSFDCTFRGVQVNGCLDPEFDAASLSEIWSAYQEVA